MGKTRLTVEEMRQFPTIEYLVEMKENVPPTKELFVKKIGDEIYFGSVGLGWVFAVSLEEIWREADKQFPEGWDPAKVIVFYALSKDRGCEKLKPLITLYAIDSDSCVLQSVPMIQQTEEMHKSHAPTRENTTENSVVVHQVRLADLKELAELWEISEWNLGLEVWADSLVPVCLDDREESKDSRASLKKILEIAEEADLFSNEWDGLNLVVQVIPSDDNTLPRIRLTTVDVASRPQEYPTKWWTFAGGFRDKLS